MSNKKHSASRTAKRARVVGPVKVDTKQRDLKPILVALLAVVVIVVVGGGALVLKGRPQTAKASDPASVAVAPAHVDVPVVAAVAATGGHAPYAQVVAEDGQVRLPLSTFDDGLAHHYTYMAGDRPIEFFALQSADGTVRAAFNACDVCFQAKRGYSQQGDVMVCNNCGQRFPSDQINVVKGGCNPSPLDRAVEGDILTLQVTDIVAGASFF